MHFYYHGTSLYKARELLTMELRPQSVPEYAALDWREYTDFGKGFYTHPEESKRKAVEWAKSKNPEWGVVRFGLTTAEMSSISGSPLYFRDKRNSRPGNAPVLFDDKPANWIEFVEYNRAIRRPPCGIRTTTGPGTIRSCADRSGASETAAWAKLALPFPNTSIRSTGDERGWLP